MDARSRDEVLAVLAKHARILERHADSLDVLLEDTRRFKSSLETVISSQREMNQLIAGIHSLYARLDCVNPRGKRPSSAELALVRGEED